METLRKNTKWAKELTVYNFLGIGTIHLHTRRNYPLGRSPLALNCIYIKPSRPISLLGILRCISGTSDTVPRQERDNSQRLIGEDIEQALDWMPLNEASAISYINSFSRRAWMHFSFGSSGQEIIGV
jgi:hypothetical protein